MQATQTQPFKIALEGWDQGDNRPTHHLTKSDATRIRRIYRGMRANSSFTRDSVKDECCSAADRLDHVAWLEQRYSF